MTAARRCLDCRWALPEWVVLPVAPGWRCRDRESCQRRAALTGAVAPDAG